MCDVNGVSSLEVGYSPYLSENVKSLDEESSHDVKLKLLGGLNSMPIDSPTAINGGFISVKIHSMDL